MELDAMHSVSISDSDSETNLSGIFDWKGDALKIRDRISQEEPEGNGDVNQNGMQGTLPAYENLQDDACEDDAFKKDLLNKDASDYQLEKYSKHAMIIFNNKIVLGGTVRNYTMKDEAALKATFGKLGFIVESHLDLTKAALMKELKTFSNQLSPQVEFDAALANPPTFGVTTQPLNDDIQEQINAEESTRDPLIEYENLEDENVGRLPKKNADTYQLEKYSKNAMIIFNNIVLLGGPLRNNTMKDEVALKATFGKFGFIIERHLDLKKAELMQELEAFCSKDFSDYGCICAVIMTHGSKNGYLRAHDTRYSEHEIIEYFNAEKNITMLGKPIVIIIQACRGQEPATAVTPNASKTEEKFELDNDDHYTLPTEADMLIFHSSYIGRASVRTDQGSWFIQALCDQINLLAAVADFETICRAVKREVATEKQHNMTLGQRDVVVKQMPVMTSTLMRLLYLRNFEGTDQEDGTGRRAEDIKKFEEGLCSETSADGCGCDEYFDYLKRCLRSFISENPDDEVAASILQISEKKRTINGVKLVDLIRNYLDRNMNRFTRGDVVYLGRPCCSMKPGRAGYLNCCNVV